MGKDVLERTIRFAALDWCYKNKHIDVKALINNIESLQWDNGDRYYKTSEGIDIVVFVDSDGEKLRGQIGMTRRTDLPGTEANGQRGYLNLKKGTGLFEASHFFIYVNKHKVPIIAYDYNMFAPKISRLGEYLHVKFPDELETYSFDYILSGSIDDALEQMEDVKKIRFRAHSLCTFGDFSKSMSRAFTALQKGFGAEVIEVSIRASKKKDSRLTLPSKDKISQFMSSGDGQNFVESFIINYIDKKTQNREEKDLVSLFLHDRVTVKKVSERSRMIDRFEMYNYLQQAVIKHKALLDGIRWQRSE